MGIREWFGNFKARLREYFIDEHSVGEWLPWGGLVRGNVVRNKDYSFLGILEYGALSTTTLPVNDFPKGWSFWSEQQHTDKEDRFFLVVCWNPFWGAIDRDVAENTLTERKVRRRQAADYFGEELSRIADGFRQTDASCRMLEYQEIVDFLSFSLSIGRVYVDLPDVPLYLDVLLSEPLHAEFEENGLSVCGRSVMILSLPSFPRGAILDEIRQTFSPISFRYVRRLLSMKKEDAEAGMKAYVKNWCGNRGYIKRAILDGLLSDMNGYANEQIIFLIAPYVREQATRYIQSRMDAFGVPYILEKYNAKDVWWGSLAGCFRADIRPILSGFKSFNDFLIEPQKGSTANV